MEANNTKTLWLLLYHTGQPDPRNTTGHLEFFYAADYAEARSTADKFKVERAEALKETIYEEYLEPQEHGFTVHRTILSGKLQFNPDGTPKSSPLSTRTNEHD